MKLTKKLLAIAVVAVMAFSMSVMAFAADTYTITINNTAAGHTYEAYQIFTGDLYNGILSNVVWGSAIYQTTGGENATVTDNSAAFLAALKADAVTGATFADDVTAADAAESLGTITADDAAIAQRFAEIAEANLISGSAVGTSTFGTNYTISNLEQGYYLVKDKDGTLAGDNDAYTRYILEVVDDVAVNPKTGLPTVTKKVKENVKYTANGGFNDVADYNIGDTVAFKLTATLPQNYADYDDGYTYIFHDTQSAGLTFDPASVVVTATTGGVVTTLTADEDYSLVTTNIGAETFQVKFDDLTAVDGLTASSIITVTYNSTLNNGAEIGLDGNPNTVNLEYSNNPNVGNEGETGKTPDDTVIVFTYELDVTKIDGEDETKKLQGAEFKLYRVNAATEPATNEYAIVENGRITGWAATETDGTTLVSDANGLFAVAGLDDGSYFLRETRAPNGYNLLEGDIALTIAATTANGDNWNSKDAGDALTALTITVNGGDAANGALDTGIVPMNVANNSGATLPSTGGIGRTIFYVVGGLLMVGAAILLITKKRMSFTSTMA